MISVLPPTNTGAYVPEASKAELCGWQDRRKLCKLAFDSLRHLTPAKLSRATAAGVDASICRPEVHVPQKDYVQSLPEAHVLA